MSFDMEMEDFEEDKVLEEYRKNVLITGVSSGLGKSLKDNYIEDGHNVYGLSRTKVDDCNHICLDLTDSSYFESKLSALLNGLNKLDVVILNAGILGDIKTFDKWSYNELQEIMDVNVWANKRILDYLFKNNIEVKQVICISSGASEHTYKGWSGYSISKAAVRMMMEVYSKEVEDIHFISLAPGLVDTKMQDYLCNDVDIDKFPVMKKFIQAKKDGTTRKPEDVANDIIDLIPSLDKFDNGSFIDLRNV